MEQWARALRKDPEWEVREEDGRIYGSLSITEPVEMPDCNEATGLWKQRRDSSVQLEEMRDRLAGMR